MTREQVLEAIQREHARFLDAIDGVAPQDITSEKVVGEWTIKDMLGHIAMWMGVAIKFIEEYKLDEMPKSLGLKDDAAVEAFNARGWEARHELPLGHVRDEFDAAYRKLIAAVEKLDDTELNAPLRAPWEKGVTLERLIAINSYAHDPEHTEQVSKWRAQKKIPNNAKF